MPSVLLIGYGNISRRDDGVALHILQRLRTRLGLVPSELDEDADGELDASLAMLAVHQLGPELAETIVGYDAVVFIDAHVEGVAWEPVHWQEIAPAYRPNIVTHHLRPDSVLALCVSLYGHGPRGFVLSVLGTDFDFGEELSADTSAFADQAMALLLTFLQGQQAA
jgi:hydrogenase maturation protease